MSTSFKPDIFVIGTVSFDVLHLANRQTVHAAGGAGMYTALAAQRAGARVGLFAPLPDPMPELLQPIVARLDWVGPSISPADLPRLEIEHHGGGRATLQHASWGAEAQLTPETLPRQITKARLVHIAALSSTQRQLDFLHALKNTQPTSKGRQPLISAGTYARLVYGDRQRVRQLFNRADIFFMNENEARGIFGGIEKARTQSNASGTLSFITLGEAGTLVVEGGEMTHIPGQLAIELDPTGAGDTFCGAVLAGLARDEAPVTAAAQAVALAAKTVSAIGPNALLRD